MQAALLTTKASQPRGMLYPLLIIAAISVIVFSILGAAAIAGWLPRAQSSTERPLPQQQGTAIPSAGERAADYRSPGNRLTDTQDAARATDNRQVAGVCTDCGVVDSIAPIEVKGQTNGVGMVAGGVTGALVGNQVGHGNGNALATVGGAAGGALAGNEIEKHVKNSVQYKIRVRMHDGTFRTMYQPAAPGFGVGDKVRIANGRILKAG